MGRFRTAAGLLAAAVVAVGLAGCGGESASISAGVIARAAASTEAQESARIAMTMEVDGEVVEVDGAIAMDGSAVRMTYALPGLGEMEQLLVDGVMFMRIPGADAEFGTEWVSVRMDALLPEQQLEARSSNGADPVSSLEALAGADGEVETVGREELRAGSATRYRVALDSETALRRMRDEGVEPTEDQIGAARAMDGVPIDVWIGDDDQMWKMAFTMRLPEGTVHMTMELYDFGAPVDVVAPPASATTDVTDRMRAELPVS